MSEKTIAPYGSWKSPITSSLIAAGAIGLTHPVIAEDGIYWIEMRPSEGGRSVVSGRSSATGLIEDQTPSPFNARTRVHEYGGGDFAVWPGSICFSNFEDQRIYIKSGDSAPFPVTAVPAQPAGIRYADYTFEAKRQRLICVREEHSEDRGDAAEPRNTIASINLDTAEPDFGQVLVSGNDFYCSPRLSPDGLRLAWLTWNHPNMPWDGTELWTAEWQPDGSLGGCRIVAGGLNESIFQPEWSPDGELYFISDRNGWWNLFRLNAAGEVEPVCEMEAELGGPQWLMGMSSYAFEAPDRIVCSYVAGGISRLALIDTGTRDFTPVKGPYTAIQYLRASRGQVVFRGGSALQPMSIVRLDLASMHFEVLRHSMTVEIDEGYISTPEAIEFPTAGGQTAHGLFYPPANRDYRARDGERPPLLVNSHGGPTSAAVAALSVAIQYFTSRGIGVLDVNYGGSTGYGRAYRERLKGQWGIVDVDDCVNGALYLAERGEVDGNRLMISGGSAGGYTTLCALTFRDAFKAGASHFGVSDLEALARDTHKFESRYLDGMIGPYPERRDLYFKRSPINFTDQLRCPVIFFQGLEDKVVPPNQAESMVSALRAKGLPVAYIAFAGEQHGFRQAEHIKRALDGELYFYARVFGFDLADEVDPVKIENL